jgi:DNA-binding transcriptional LysR family regulator
VQAEIELRKMQFVVAVAEERSFTRAARRRHVSQPALSRQIQEVEQALGISLFERHPRRITVTQAGRLFVREAKYTVEQGRRAVSLVQALARREERPVAAGLSALTDLPRLHGLLEQAERTAPDTSVSILAGYTSELTLDLLRGELDLAVLDLPILERGINLFPLFSEPLVAVVPEALFSTKRLMALTDILSSPLVLLTQAIDPSRAVIERALASTGNRAFKIHDAGSIPELLDRVALQHRVGLLRRSATRFQRQGVTYTSLADPIQVGCALAWRADNRRPVVVLLRDTITALHKPT